MLDTATLRAALGFVAHVLPAYKPGARDIPYAWIEPEGADTWVVATNGHRMAAVRLEGTGHLMTEGMLLELDCVDDDVSSYTTLLDGMLLTDSGLTAMEVPAEFVDWRRPLRDIPETNGDQLAHINAPYHLEALQAVLGFFGEWAVVQTLGDRTIWKYSPKYPAPFAEAWVMIAPAIDP